MARDWLLAALRDAGAIDSTDEQAKDAISKHFVAVLHRAGQGGSLRHRPGHTPSASGTGVGGRYSVDSAVGTVLAVAIGPDAFADFLDGFHAIDVHFAGDPAGRGTCLR